MVQLGCRGDTLIINTQVHTQHRARLVYRGISYLKFAFGRPKVDFASDIELMGDRKPSACASHPSVFWEYASNSATHGEAVDAGRHVGNSRGLTTKKGRAYGLQASPTR